MKLLTVVVPCYNSQDYMERCVDSLLIGGDRMEIIIVDDGSKDATGEIADRYAAAHPGVVRVIHKENGGHGSGVNAGIEHAAGLYFKVVDSDDWVEPEALAEVLRVLGRYAGEGEQLDLLITNFMYDKLGAARRKVMSYEKVYPEGRVFSWDEASSFSIGQYMMIHAQIYRTSLLREIELRLPHHTFYVDNLYCFVPLLHVSRMYYLNADLYHYCIGRADQSVSEQVMLKRIDQQFRINLMLLDSYRPELIESPQLRRYLLHFMNLISLVLVTQLCLVGDEESMRMRRDYWKYIRRKDVMLYLKMRYSIYGLSANMPGRPGRGITRAGYRLARRRYGFN